MSSGQGLSAGEGGVLCRYAQILYPGPRVEDRGFQAAVAEKPLGVTDVGAAGVEVP